MLFCRLIYYTYRLLKKRKTAAGVGQFRYILVDEFQDSTEPVCSPQLPARWWCQRDGGGTKQATQGA